MTKHPFFSLDRILYEVTFDGPLIRRISMYPPSQIPKDVDYSECPPEIQLEILKYASSKKSTK